MSHLLVYVLVNSFIVLIWAITNSGGFFSGRRGTSGIQLSSMRIRSGGRWPVFDRNSESTTPTKSRVAVVATWLRYKADGCVIRLIVANHAGAPSSWYLV